MNPKKYLWLVLALVAQLNTAAYSKDLYFSSPENLTNTIKFTVPDAPKDAKAPTWAEAWPVLNAYRGNEEPYTLHVHDCKHYAVDLLKFCHALKWPAYFTIVSYKEGSSHAIVALDTSDIGRVFIDMTAAGSKPQKNCVHISLDDPAIFVPLTNAKALKRADRYEFRKTKGWVDTRKHVCRINILSPTEVNAASLEKKPSRTEHKPVGRQASQHQERRSHNAHPTTNQ